MEAPIKRTREEWDAFFYHMAEEVAGLSKDPDRKVGAVLVSPDRRQMSIGFNGFPPDVEDLPSLLADRDFKLEHMRHAEHNCLEQAPFCVAGSTVYVTRFPCRECATKLRDAKVARLVTVLPDFNHHRWGKSWFASTLLLGAAGVEITCIGESD